jgi:hypothetical protein
LNKMLFNRLQANVAYLAVLTPTAMISSNAIAVVRENL